MASLRHSSGGSRSRPVGVEQRKHRSRDPLPDSAPSDPGIPRVRQAWRLPRGGGTGRDHPLAALVPGNHRSTAAAGHRDSRRGDRMTDTPDVYVHPRGICESDDVGSGTRIWAFAHVLKGAQIGRGCNICDGAFVEDGAVLGNGVTVKNGTLVFSGVTCEDDVFLGPNVLFT